MATELARWHFTVDDYHRMVESGILTENDRVELIDGEIVQMSAVGPRHVSSLREVTRLLYELAMPNISISVQDPIQLDERSEPVPDLTVLRAHAGEYVNALPTSDDIILVIEVSDTTLSYDRNVKLPLYASGNIPEAWIIDLPGQAIERHSEPVEDSYRVVSRVGRGRQLASSMPPRLILRTDDIIGPW